MKAVAELKGHQTQERRPVYYAAVEPTSTTRFSLHRTGPCCYLSGCLCPWTFDGTEDCLVVCWRGAWMELEPTTANIFLRQLSTTSRNPIPLDRQVSTEYPSRCCQRINSRGPIRCSESLLAVALVNATVWMVKLALFCCDFSLPSLSGFYNILMSGLWMFCVHVQSSSDLTDLEHISIRPWYLAKSCAALAGKDRDICRRGKIAFTIATVCM